MWLQSFKEGDMVAFEQLVLSYRRPAVLFALQLTRDLASAEDAVQEAFAWLLVHRDRIRVEKGLKPLLYTLVRRRCVDWFRGARRLIPLDEQVDEAAYEPEAVFPLEDKWALYHALGEMPPRYGRVIHLLDIEGFSQQEAAQILSITKGAVKVMHHRAKKQLRLRLEKEGFNP